MSITSLLAAAFVGLAVGQVAPPPATPPAATSASSPMTSDVAAEAVHSTDDDDKMVCRRVRKTGSNMLVNDCRTVGQRRKEMEDVQQALRNRPPDPTKGN